MVKELPDGVDVTQRLFFPEQDWSDALVGVSEVVYCAARVCACHERINGRSFDRVPPGECGRNFVFGQSGRLALASNVLYS